eukprot:364968-Chlamydomonas_euryale.AAC.4
MHAMQKLNGRMQHALRGPGPGRSLVGFVAIHGVKSADASLGILSGGSKPPRPIGARRTESGPRATCDCSYVHVRSL